jgi:hypothetical protein
VRYEPFPQMKMKDVRGIKDLREISFGIANSFSSLTLRLIPTIFRHFIFISSLRDINTRDMSMETGKRED